MEMRTTSAINNGNTGVNIVSNAILPDVVAEFSKKLSGISDIMSESLKPELRVRE